MLIKLLLVTFLPSSILGFEESVSIGALFEEDSLLYKAFKSSIASLNDERRENTDLPDQFIQPEQVITFNNDSYDVSRAVCDLANRGIATIFGPQNEITLNTVQSMCEAMDIPHVVARWDSKQRRKNVINMYPYSHSLSKAYLQLVMSYKWKRFTILYENTESLVRMKQLLERWDIDGYTITVRQLSEGPDYRPILRSIKHSGDKNIILDCSIDILPEVLKQAQQVGVMSDKHNFIIASLDVQTVDLEPYRHGGTNFTGFRLVDPENPAVIKAFERYNLDWNLENPTQLTVEAALVYDGVQLFGRALKQLDEAHNADVKTSLCENLDSWELGESLFNYLKHTEFRGLTGLVKFDTAGYRSNFKMDVISLNLKGVEKVGVWNNLRGVEFLPQPLSEERQIELSLQNKTFIVLISLTAPYGMLKESANMEVGNDRYEGFGVDIIAALANFYGFNYTFQEHDPTYGSKNKTTGKWNGMIREIMEDRADLAITDLTITADRQEAVDFTFPFMTLGISILFTKPAPAGSDLFSFLSPFSSEVWMCLIGAYVLVSLLLFVVGRICPAEWNNPYPCIEEPEELENQFSFKNSFWFNLGAIMQQGSEIAPIGLSTRMMAGAWWFFCLIIVASYTANLAAFLVIESKDIKIRGIEDLPDNPYGIKYGAKRSGSTMDYFNDNEGELYKNIRAYMKEHADEVLADSNEAGVRKVLEADGKYAYFMESSTIKYEAERQCALTQVGPLITSKSYGIAIKKDSVYRQPLSTAIIKLQESGVLKNLEDKWWRQKRGGGNCDEKKQTSEADALGTANVGGVFVVLIAGTAISCFYTAWELLWEVGCTSVKENISFKTEIKEELKFVIRCNATTKPVRRRKNSMTSNESLNEISTRGCSPPYGFVPTVNVTTEPEER